MEGFTDIHCHILSGVDDGAKNLTRSIAMLKMAYEEGIRNVILTPHYHAGRMEASMENIIFNFNKLVKESKIYADICDMNIYLGNEIYYYPSVIEWLQEKRVLTLAESDYVLLEFGYTCDVRMIKEGVTSLRNEGYIPIVAHVERYKGITSSLSEVDDLINRGAYIQINAESLFGSFRTKSFVKNLLKNEKVHFIATDSHNISERAPLMKDAAKYIKRHYGEDYMHNLLINNPNCVINNEYLM